MASSIKIAKVISTKNKKFSIVECDIEIFDEESMKLNKTVISCLSFQVEEHLMKHYDVLLVSPEQYDEYVDPLVEKIMEEKEKQKAAMEEREKQEFFSSLSGIRLQIYNDLQLEREKQWRKVADLINEEFSRRYLTGGGVFSGGTNWKREGGWEPLGG